MSELTQTTSTEVVSAKMAIALTKASLGIQTLSDIESKLVYNEDNLVIISEYIDKAKQAKKIIESEHKNIKEPFLKECQTIDESKRNMLFQIDAGLTKAQTNYTKLCTDIENRRKAVELDNQRKQNIKTGIDNNMISFSGRIAECKTNKELTAIESLINLEKGRKDKYAEFFDEAVEKYSSLTVLLTAQKQTVKEYEKVELERIAAEKSGNDEAILKAREDAEKLAATMEEAKIIIQETAISSTQSNATVETAVEVLPDVSVRRKSWTWEISDIAKTVKTMPSWTKIETVDSEIDNFMKASKETWGELGKEEMIVNGIRFYIKKSY